jgi:hypothetical protein
LQTTHLTTEEKLAATEHALEEALAKVALLERQVRLDYS